MTPLRFALALLAAAATARAVESDSAVEKELAAANALFDAQHHDEAKAAFAKVLALDPKNADANYRLGLYACDRGEWEKALAYEAKALAHDPNQARYQYGWGAANGISAMKSGIFSKLGYAHQCLAAYKRAVELEPTNAQYHFAVFSFYQQAPGFAGGDKDLAFAEAAQIKQLNPALGRKAYAQFYLAQKKYDLAFHEYEDVLRQSPNDYEALYTFGLLALFSGQRLDDGANALRQCLKLDVPKQNPSHADVHWRLGSLCEKMGKPGDARSEYVAALAEDPKFGPATTALKKLPPVPSSSS